MKSLLIKYVLWYTVLIWNPFLKSAKLTIVVFFSRNILRLSNEYKYYNYNIFENVFFKKDQKNFKIFNNIKIINKCNTKQDILICSENNIELKITNNSYIYYRKSKWTNFLT